MFVCFNGLPKVQLFCLVVLQSCVLTMFYCLCSRMLNKKINKRKEPNGSEKLQLRRLPGRPGPPRKPGNPDAPVLPCRPLSPGGPEGPCRPGDPVFPAKPWPVAPVAPWAPGKPISPSEPTKPCDPVLPTKPIKPGDPVAPGTFQHMHLTMHFQCVVLGLRQLSCLGQMSVRVP